MICLRASHLLILSLVASTVFSEKGTEEEETLKSSLNLSNQSCEDKELELAKAILEDAKTNTETSRKFRWAKKQELWKSEATERNILNKIDIRNSSDRELQLMLHRGPSNLNENQKNQLLKLESSLDELKNKLIFVEEDGDDEVDNVHNLTNAEDFLRSDQDPSEMLDYWEERFKNFHSKYGVEVSRQIFDLLNLLKQEAKIHGFDSVPSYWEEICEVPGHGYQDMEEIWTEVKPIYLKLRDFLMREFNVTTNSSLIPPYLLGSFSGDDWSLIIEQLLDSESLDELRKFEEILSNEASTDPLWAIKRAQIIVAKLGLKTLLPEAIKTVESSSCPTQIVSLCFHESDECSKKLGIALCSSHSPNPQRWHELIEIIEQMARDAYRRTSTSSCITKYAARYSAVETAVIGAVVIRALEETQLSSNLVHLIVALRTLPALGHAVSADHSRVSAVMDSAFGVPGVNDTFDLYWTRAQRNASEIEIEENWQTYIVDDDIITNKPKLSTFLGLVLQFRLLKSSNLSATLNNLAKVGLSMPWPDAVKEYVIVQDENPWEPIENYFHSLNNIIEKGKITQKPTDEGGNTVAYACVGVIIVILLLGIGWWYWKKHRTGSANGAFNNKRRGRYTGAKSEEEGREMQTL